jgi:L-lactate dehydrogenase complex protein LldF
MSQASRLFDRASKTAAHDRPRQQIVRKSLVTYNLAFEAGKQRFASWQSAKDRAHAIKAEAVAHLDSYLLQFERKVQERGGHVFWAETAAEARDYVLGLAKRHGVRHVIKSKSMVSEEIHLGAALESAGIEAVETDLGEFIVQLRHEPPYHIVTPAMHLERAQIAELFQRELHTPPGAETAEELTAAARVTLREKFLNAGMGITGANFLIADEGLVAITENEGNARLTFSMPRIHVALTGVEKVLPRLADLSLFWPVLATAGTGQAISCYNSLIGGPRRADEVDGPEQFHVVLLDNGRTNVLADGERRDALHCIRCGACLNVCPVFHTIGGHAYGATYSGPIGSVLVPLLWGLGEYGHMSYASSLCGACTEVCPVEIDLHRHLIHNRRDMGAKHLRPAGERRGLALWRWASSDARRFERAGNLMRRLMRIKSAVVPEGSPLDPLRPWTRQRAFVPAPAESFRQWWRRERPNSAGRPEEGKGN